MKRTIHWVIVAVLMSVGCESDSPSAPSGTVSSVTVAPANPGDSVFIGETTQFRATSSLSNGQTEMRAGTWGSDNPNVATVDQNGLVTGVSAGEATIFVDVNPRGALLVQVLPSFGGSWTGTSTITACDDSGDFAGVCDAAGAGVGTIVGIPGTFTQMGATVNAVLDYSENLDLANTVTTNGTVSVPGELRLTDAEMMPPAFGLVTRQENWRSRSDQPGVMTGSYEFRFTAPGVSGFRTLYESTQ